MRIALNLLYLIPCIVGGTETYALSLLRALEQIDSENEYYVFINNKTSKLNLTSSSNFRYIICPFYAKYQPIRYAFEQLILPWLLKKYQIDLVHSLGYVGPIITPCPSIVTIHDVNFHALKEIMPLMKRFFLKLFVKQSVQHSTHIITISNFSNKQIGNYFGVKPNKISVIYLGPRKIISEFKNVEWHNLATCYRIKKPYIVSFCGGVHKNMARLINAFISLCSDFPHNLVLIGNLSPMNRKQIVKSFLEKHVNAIGYVPDEHVLPILAVADLFIFPSWYEGFGLPILEAQQVGTPVACSLAGSLPEIAGDGAIFFDPYSVEEIINSIRLCLKNNDIQKLLVNKGYENVKRFSWRKVALKTLKVYEKVYENVKKN